MAIFEKKHQKVIGFLPFLEPIRLAKLTAAGALLCAAISCQMAPKSNIAANDSSIFPANDRILFQGDSITDGNRGRNSDPNHILGHGYAFIIASRFGGKYPEKNLAFLNRGCSGNKVTDLIGRWQQDTIQLKPDVLSIAIGINDYCGKVTADKFEENYEQLLSETVKAMPNVRLVLCEPFGLQVGHFKDNWNEHRTELQKRQAIVAKLADKYKAVLVRFQKIFDDACLRAPADYWIWDGIHPTYSGHQLMADEWIRAVAEARTGKLQKENNIQESNNTEMRTK